MVRLSGRPASWLSALLAALVLSACGGGGDDNNSSLSQQSAEAGGIRQSNVQQSASDPSKDSIDWFNLRRQQAGLAILERNNLIDKAAQGHSDYQKTNDVVTHTQTRGKPGFTGETLSDRIKNAGYQFSSSSGLAYGEVIAGTSNPSGAEAAEDLITAIYHRFVIFEPRFKEIGSGTAVAGDGMSYFTTNFAANGLDVGLASGQVVVYPVPDQQRVTRIFFSDNEAPDPVPDRNEVGYPISVHANITSTVTVQSFTVRPRGGAVLAVRLLTRATDAQTPASVAAIVPLAPLTAGATYDVQFSGLVDGIRVDRSWSFTVS